MRFPYNLIAFNHFDWYLVQRVGIFSALGLSIITMSGLLIEFDFFFCINRHVHVQYMFHFHFLLFVRHFDAALFADIPEDVRSGLVVSKNVIGLF